MLATRLLHGISELGIALHVWLAFGPGSRDAMACRFWLTAAKIADRLRGMLFSRISSLAYVARGTGFPIRTGCTLRRNGPATLADVLVCLDGPTGPRFI